jgi:hypothetical protein
MPRSTLLHAYKTTTKCIQFLKNNHICCVMISVLTSNLVDHGTKPCSDQTTDNKINSCCFFAKHPLLMSKIKNEFIQRDHNCVRFYAYCWFYFNGSSLKENSPLVNIVASFERIILNSFLILLISNGCLAKKQQLLILLSVVWSEQGLVPWSTKFEVSTLIKLKLQSLTNSLTHSK